MAKRIRLGMVAALALGMLAAPLAVGAQQARQVARVGYLGATAAGASPHVVEAFRQSLREQGYVEGQNLAIEFRWAEGRADRFPALAAELVSLAVDVIFAPTTPAALAAKDATTTIPIVFVLVGDPVGTGLVQSLARPGGTITGTALLSPEVNEKRLELLKETVPGLSRVAVLLNPGRQAHEQQVKDLSGAGRVLGVQIRAVGVQRAEDLEGAFAAMSRESAGAVFVLVSPLHHLEMQRIVDLAKQHRLPAVMEFNDFAEKGGLMAYGPRAVDLYRRAGSHVGKILKGTKPADLPVEQPTKFELVINLKTAKALGLTIPQSILIRADQVIQ